MCVLSVSVFVSLSLSVSLPLYLYRMRRSCPNQGESATLTLKESRLRNIASTGYSLHSAFVAFQTSSSREDTSAGDGSGRRKTVKLQYSKQAKEENPKN